MRTKRMAAIAAAGAVSALLLGAAPSGAGVVPIPTLDLVVTPTSGPGGTVVTVSGTQCVQSDGPGDVEFGLTAFPASTPVVIADAVPDAEGNWTGQVTVPPGTDPEGSYAVEAWCTVDIGGGETADVVIYHPVGFDVTEDGPTPTTAPPTPTPGTPTPPPATPVVRPPDQTG